MNTALVAIMLTGISSGRFVRHTDLYRQLIFAPYCELIVELPEDRMHSADNYRCYRANRAECNITGRWKDYDSDVELACRTYVSPIVDYSPFSMVYKNVYCYYCNGFKAQQFTHLCPDLYKGQRSNLRTSFSALIDF